MSVDASDEDIVADEVLQQTARELSLFFEEHPEVVPHAPRIIGIVTKMTLGVARAVQLRSSKPVSQVVTSTGQIKAGGLADADLRAFVARMIDWARKSAQRQTSTREPFLLVYYAYYALRRAPGKINLRPYLEEHVDKSLHRQFDIVLNEGFKKLRSVGTRGLQLTKQFHESLQDEERERWSPLLQVLITFGAGGAFVAASTSHAAAATGQAGGKATNSALVGILKTLAAALSAGVIALWYFLRCAPSEMPVDKSNVDTDVVGSDVHHSVIQAKRECEGKPPYLFRQCIVSLADSAELRGNHSKAVALYESAAPIDYPDSDVPTEDRERYSNRTGIHSVPHAHWKWETIDILDKAAHVLWRMGLQREATRTYQRLVDICQDSSFCDNRRGTLLAMLYVLSGQPDSLGRSVVAGHGRHFWSSYVEGRTQEALGNTAWALVQYARQLRNLTPVFDGNPPSDEIARWNDVLPDGSRTPPDAYDRYHDLIRKLARNGQGLQQGHVFVFVTHHILSDPEDIVIIVTIDPLEAFKLSCSNFATWRNGDYIIPSFYFDYTNPPPAPHNSNWESVPVATHQFDPEPSMARIKMRTLFYVKTSELQCQPLEDQIDICLDGETVQQGSACISRP